MKTHTTDQNVCEQFSLLAVTHIEQETEFEELKCYDKYF